MQLAAAFQGGGSPVGVCRVNNGRTEFWRVRLGKPFTGGSIVTRQFSSLDEARKWVFGEAQEEKCGLVGGIQANRWYLRHLRAGNPDSQSVQRIVLTASRSKPVREPQEVFFVDCIQPSAQNAFLCLESTLAVRVSESANKSPGFSL